MSDIYKPPPWQVPTRDNIQRPTSLQVNVKVPADADGADQSALFKVAQDIVGNNANNLDNFTSVVRRDQSISNQNYVDRSRQMDGLDARWQYNNGYEKLSLNVYPYVEGGPPRGTSETNLDGYVAWVHGDPGYPDPNFYGAPGFPGPYNIFLNGYLIEQNFQPKGPVGGYVITFGKTAMLCDDYENDKLKTNIGWADLKLPNAINPPKGWGEWKAGASPTGVNQQAYAKYFGYWILDWTNTLNPCQYMRQFGKGQPFRDWHDLLIQGEGGPPQLTKGWHFKNSLKGKSPLIPNGMNGVSATLSPASIGTTETITVDVWIGEFYDRGKYRTVSQSWTRAAHARETININDYPLMYGGGIWQGGFSSGAGIKFDLTPSVTAKFKTSNQDTPISTMVGPHDGLDYGSADDNLAGLTDDQLSIYQGWEAEVAAAAQAYSEQIAQQLAPLQQLLTDKVLPAYNNAYKLAILGRVLQGNYKLYEKYYIDYDTLYIDQSVLGGRTHLVPPTTLPMDSGAGSQQGSVSTVTTYILVQGPDGDYGFQQVPTAPPKIQPGAYYLDLTEPLSDFIVHLTTADQLLKPKTKETATTEVQDPPLPYGVPPPSSYTVTVTDFYSVVNYSFLTNTLGSGINGAYLGPGSYADFIALANLLVPQAGEAYLNLIAEMQMIQNTPPPDAPPIPFVGNNASEFEGGAIDISGTKWSFNQ